MLRRATGCSSQEFGFLLFRQAVAGLPSKKDEPSSERMRSALAALEEIGPRDCMEGMLAAQLLSLHSVAMDHLSRAGHPDQSPERCDKYVNNAAKLTRAFAQQLEALQRYRGKGQQKVTVEHVHVHSGGQAIVGAVAASGGKGERE